MATIVGTPGTGSVSGSTTCTTSISATAGRLLVLVYRCRAGNNRTYSLSQTAGTTITTTLIIDTDTTIAGNDTVAWWGIAQGTETVTFVITASGSDTGNSVLMEIIDFDTGTPIRNASQYFPSATNNHDILGSSGLDIAAGEIIVGGIRIQADRTVTAPSGSTAQYSESLRGGIYTREVASPLTAEKFTLASASTATTSEIGSFVVQTAAAEGGQPFRKRWGGVRHNAYTSGGVW